MNLTIYQVTVNISNFFLYVDRKKCNLGLLINTWVNDDKLYNLFLPCQVVHFEEFSSESGHTESVILWFHNTRDW